MLQVDLDPLTCVHFAQVHMLMSEYDIKMSYEMFKP